MLFRRRRSLCSTLFCPLETRSDFPSSSSAKAPRGLGERAPAGVRRSYPCCSMEDLAMRYDFSPLYRSTVGFDRLFDMLDQATVEPMTNWPPYNIEKLDEDQYRITMAVAGFAPEEIQL